MPHSGWKKRSKNLQRDQDQLARINDLGWRALVIWECEVKNQNQLAERLCSFLN